MKHWLFKTAICLTASSVVPLLAQTPAAQPPSAKPETYAQTVTADDLRKHLTILAADDMEGRETGTRGQKKAAEYIAGQFSALGLKAVVPGADGKTSYMQPFTLYKKTWGDFYVKSGGKQFTYLKDFLTNGLIALPQETNYETVFVNYGIVDDKFNDYVNLDVKGKAVVMLDGEPKNADGTSAVTNSAEPSRWGKPDSWRYRAQVAKDKGAAQVFIISAANADEFKRLLTERAALQQRFNRLSLKAGQENVGTVGTFMISTEMAAALLGKKAAQLTKAIEQIKSKGMSTVGKLAGTVAVKAERKDENVQTENVMGFVEGTDKKDEVVIVSSHYDHIGISPDGQINNGANDDGSGTVSVLELAQAFAKAKAEGNGPRRSMLFLTVVGEEKGLLGSEYYTDFSPVLPLANTVCDLNIDMVGRVDNLHENKSPKDNYIYVIGSDKLSSDLHRISENANSQYTQMELDYKYNDPKDPERIYYRSDHYNFAKHKIPIIFYFNGLHADYHRPTDDIEKMDFNLAEKTARLVFYTAWEVANREERLKVDSNKQ
ncbi:M28 family peptidase [Rudanella paleaurantiibacter]|uniref:M28 family peptidase n=1 Tax=Rudanella paleaurantiibacter TaxID=2614655 RepID=A0A7J5U2L1_9BACT|nr:M28 family peptidase [Rudanella paleaurantiibacter]KAB7732039.1 M28 family peptidase [Rudanella paleaurantiibacter]